MTQYFVHQNGENIGPMDFVTVVRRLRQGRIIRETLMTSDVVTETMPAYLIPEIKEAFDDQVIIDSQPDAINPKELSFIELLKDGFEFFKFNQSSALLTGAFLFVMAVGISIFSLIPSGIVAKLLTGFWVFFVFSFLLFAMLRRSRMQMITLAQIIGLLRSQGKNIAIVSLMTMGLSYALPAVASSLFGNSAWILFLVPGSIIWTYFLFIPMIITDLNVGIKEAMGINFRVMKRLGLNDYSVFYALFLINFLVAPAIIPLFITLPVTLIALCEGYDSTYN